MLEVVHSAKKYKKVTQIVGAPNMGITSNVLQSAGGIYGGQGVASMPVQSMGGGGGGDNLETKNLNFIRSRKFDTFFVLPL